MNPFESPREFEAVKPDDFLVPKVAFAAILAICVSSVLKAASDGGPWLIIGGFLLASVVAIAALRAIRDL